MIMILLILMRYLYRMSKFISGGIFFPPYGCKTLIILLLVSSIQALSNFLNVDVPVPNVVTDRYFVATLR